MEATPDSKPTATLDNPEKRQDGDKTSKRIRTRSGEGTVNFWKAKLFRNTYRDRHGKTVEQPEWYCRMRYNGETRRVRLHTSDKDRAAEEAVKLASRLADEGWIAVERGMARLPASPSIEQFCKDYVIACNGLTRPPRAVTRALYVQRLTRVCKLAGVTQLRELTAEAVKRAHDTYLAEARAAKRRADSITNSLSAVFRNAAACFSKKIRPELAKLGYKIETNPFDGMEKGQDIEAVTALSPDTVERIWKELPLLREGDQNATDPATPAPRKKGPARKNGTAWGSQYDWRKPHPDAWGAVLLALGAGLRANECDKARWSWFRFDTKGGCFLEVREEKDFKPKGGTKRLLRVPRELHDELAKARKDLTSPYVLGGTESEAVEKKGYGYRSRDTFRVANAWLRARGIEAEDPRGNPLHRLRKQFGSEVATSSGLFAAQKYLGHTSPAVTAKYYAGLIDLPELTHLRIVS